MAPWLAILCILNDSNPRTWAAKILPEPALFLIRNIECNRNLITAGLHALDSCDYGKASERNTRLHARSHAAAPDLSDHANFGICSDVN